MVCFIYLPKLFAPGLLGFSQASGQELESGLGILGRKVFNGGNLVLIKLMRRLEA